MKLARLKIVFTGLPEGYQTSFWAENFVIFIISSIAVKKGEPKCPLLLILVGSLVCVSLTMMSSTESSVCSFPNQWTSQDASSHPRPMPVRPLAPAAQASGASGGCGVPQTIDGHD